MDIKKLQRVIVDGLEDVKAQNIVVFDTEHLSALFERVIIASGTSNRQTKSLASSVRDAVKQSGQVQPRVEGEDNGEWIIVDCGSAVVHVMQPHIREYYHLEEIWGDKPVRMKLDSAPKQLVKAEELAAVAPKAPARKTAARKKTDGESASTVPAPAKKTAAPRKPAAATKTAAPRKPSADVGVTRTSGVKGATATKRTTSTGVAATRKTSVSSVAPSARAGSRSAPRKAPVKTIAVNKPVAKKAALARAAAAGDPPRKAAPRKATPRKTVAAKAAPATSAARQTAARAPAKKPARGS
jgi:ribosome-associated protein